MSIKLPDYRYDSSDDFYNIEKFNDNFKKSRESFESVEGELNKAVDVHDKEKNAHKELFVGMEDRVRELEYRNLMEHRKIYVTKKGCDKKGDGSIENPYLTIQKALDIIANNTARVHFQLFLGNGIYEEDFVIAHYMELDVRAIDIKETYPRNVTIKATNFYVANSFKFEVIGVDIEINKPLDHITSDLYAMSASNVVNFHLSNTRITDKSPKSESAIRLWSCPCARLHIHTEIIKENNGVAIDAICGTKIHLNAISEKTPSVVKSENIAIRLTGSILQGRDDFKLDAPIKVSMREGSANYTNIK